MKNISLVNFHIYFSVFLYVISLIFPACYLGESRQPQASTELLVAGALGIFVGAFSWYANPLFWIALYYSNKPRSIIISIFALLLALSFVFYKRVMYIDIDFQKDITSLGWGYFFWLFSMSIFLIGQIFRFSGAPSFLIPISTLIPIILGGKIIYGYYYEKADSQYRTQLERDRIYDLECEDSGTKIFGSAQGIKSIYLKGSTEEYRKYFLVWKRKSGGLSINSYANSGYIMFGEEYNYHQKHSNPEMNTPYTRYLSQRTSYVNEITSDASIVIEKNIYPPSVHLVVGKVIIEDRRNNKILATSKYVYDEYGYRLCGETSNNEFSISKLAIETLGLKRQFSSIYNK